MEKLQYSLEKMLHGSYNIWNGLEWFDDYNYAIQGVLTGEHEESYTLEKYFFNRSLDEEMCNWTSFLQDLIYYLNFNVQDVKRGSNSVDTFIKGLDELIEGITILSEVSRKNNDIKHEIKGFISEELSDTCDYNFNIFNAYGFSKLERSIRGFSRSFNKEVKDILGKYEYYKLTE